MEDQGDFSDESLVESVRGIQLDEEEEEFRSCCGDEVWKEREEIVKEDLLQENLDEFSVKMFFKGISIAAGDSGSGFSGIGVVMERIENFPVIQVQKKLDFYVDESVADYLALMDGLTEALQHKISRVYAFTDSRLLHDHVSLHFQLFFFVNFLYCSIEDGSLMTSLCSELWCSPCMLLCLLRYLGIIFT